jgi:hypothetical protein
MDPNAQGMGQGYVYYSSGDEGAGLGVEGYTGVGYSQVPHAHPYAMQNASEFSSLFSLILVVQTEWAAAPRAHRAPSSVDMLA